jgi:GxxExxY protein
VGDVDEIARVVVDAGFHIHKDLGPGLLESVYEMILAERLIRLGFKVERQRPINISYQDIEIENAFRLDILVEGRLVIEIKSVEQFSPVHAKQVLTYIKLMNLPLGLLMNFGAATFKEGIRRLVNNHKPFAS